MSIADIREQIDAIDQELVQLLKKRMTCSLEIARIKKAENLPVYHPSREQEILDRVKTECGETYGDYITDIYRQILSSSRDLQNSQNIQA